MDTKHAVIIAGFCLLPLSALAQGSPEITGEITTGIGYQSSRAPLLDRYTGNGARGMSGFGSFRVESHDAWDSGNSGYFSAEGSGVEVDGHRFSPDAATSVSVGEQGSWGAKFSYDGISSTSTRRR